MVVAAAKPTMRDEKAAFIEFCSSKKVFSSKGFVPLPVCRN
jgi:hypothetical protein